MTDSPRTAMLSVFDSCSCVYFACRRWALALVAAAVCIAIDAVSARLLSSKELLQACQVVLRGLDVEDRVGPAVEVYDWSAHHSLDALR